MEKSHDLETFIEILVSKGYDGYFQTEGTSPGKLRFSLVEYMEKCRLGYERMPTQGLNLRTYLVWDGEDKPYVVCSMWVSYLQEKFYLQIMEITKGDRYGHVLEQNKLIGLSTAQVPTAKEAIALVSGSLDQRPRHHSGFKFKI